MPKTSSNDRIIVAREEIAEAVKNPELRSPFMNGRKENEIIKELSEIFDRNKANTTEKQQESCFPATPPRIPAKTSTRKPIEKLQKTVCEKLPKQRVEKLPQPSPRVMKIQPCGNKRAGNNEIYCNGTVIYKQFNVRTWRGKYNIMMPEENTIK